jgi:hypothetical protein
MTSSRQIALVGHCGPDIFLLRSAVRRAVPSAEITVANDSSSLEQAADAGSILLINRVLDGSFASDNGIELIRQLSSRPAPPLMLLISNFPEAQQGAVAAGAAPGFGKAQLYDHSTVQKLQKLTAQSVDAE